MTDGSRAMAGDRYIGHDNDSDTDEGGKKDWEKGGNLFRPFWTRK